MLNFNSAIKKLDGSQSYGEALCKVADMVHEDIISPSLMGELVLYCNKQFLN